MSCFGSIAIFVCLSSVQGAIRALGTAPSAADFREPPQHSLQDASSTGARTNEERHGTSETHATITHSQTPSPPAPAASITLDYGDQHPVPPHLYGIFFEEIQHAGEGGLYAELVQDRSFEGLAYTHGFLNSNLQELVVSSNRAGQADASKPYGAQPVSWIGLGDTVLTLTKAPRLNVRNPVAMNLSSPSGTLGIANTGYWGLGIRQGLYYHLSLHLRALDPGQDHFPNVTITLESGDGADVYASVTFMHIKMRWQKHTALLRAEGTDHAARLVVRSQGAPLLLDVVSLFPGENGLEGSVSPFRRDLLHLLKGLTPRFLRFPGGCYVEGVVMANGFFWKPSVGPIEERPGHWNGMWEYWSTDGLGLYEYMLLAEELGAEPIWVLNNGLSHQESIPTSAIMPLVTDALDAIEFMTGPLDSGFGSLRAAMGHAKPWTLKYVGIGNEDCGKPFYVTNYIAFATAISAMYPHIHVIANCHMGADAPTDLWDWHWYTDPLSMFNGRHTFDSMTEKENGHIFASEYAVFDWGIPTKPAGNIQGAVAEAGFMTGMERNSRVVRLAAYAPLLANVNHVGTLCPTNLVVFDSYRSFGNPSYHVQALFSRFQGVSYVKTDLASALTNDAGVAAAATCADDACTLTALKMVNFADHPQLVAVQLVGQEGGLHPVSNMTVLTGVNALATNSFELPWQVYPMQHVLGNVSKSFQVTLAAWSVSVLELNLRSAVAAAST